MMTPPEILRALTAASVLAVVLCNSITSGMGEREDFSSICRDLEVMEGCSQSVCLWCGRFVDDEQMSKVNGAP